MEMHNRDITLLIVLLLCTTPACFSTFYQCAMVPTPVENSKFFCVFVVIYTGNSLNKTDFQWSPAHPHPQTQVVVSVQTHIQAILVALLLKH